jgi:hypothetical protein
MGEVMEDTEPEISKNKIIVLNSIRNISFLFFLYSSTSLIWEIYLYFFQPDNFYVKHVLFHIYGFIVSNIILLYLPHDMSKKNEE